MGTAEILLTSILAIIIWALILKGIIKSATHNIIRLLILIAKKQGASEDEIFMATKSKDEIYARERRLKKELKKKQKMESKNN
ncbi:MAG TPA: hypothetical protein VIJ75_16080 [Hanamia sp.]